MIVSASAGFCGESLAAALLRRVQRAHAGDLLAEASDLEARQSRRDLLFASDGPTSSAVRKTLMHQAASPEARDEIQIPWSGREV